MNVQLRESADARWIESYRQKRVSAEQAVKCIKSGDSIYIYSHAAAPHPLIEAMVQRADDLKDVKIVQIMTLGEADYAKPEFAESFKVHALFIGKNDSFQVPVSSPSGKPFGRSRCLAGRWINAPGQRSRY